MKLHVTCPKPTRSLVVAIRTVRHLMSPSGHQMSVSWSDASPRADGAPPSRLRLPSSPCDLLIHACTPGQSADAPPPEVGHALRAGKPVVRLELGGLSRRPAADEATFIVVRLEDMPSAILDATASTVG